MAFYSKKTENILIVLLGLALAQVVGAGIVKYKESKNFEKERTELQTKVTELEQYLSDREEAAISAVEELEEMEKVYKTNTDRLQLKLQETQKRYQETLVELGNLEAPELEDYFHERYQEAVEWEGDKFAIPVNVGNQIRYDLTDRDFCAEESDLKDSVLLEQARHIDTLNLVAEQIYTERNYLTGKITTLEQYSSGLESKNLSLEENLRCQKVQKGIFITTTSILGILLVTTLIGGSR